jgi:hypothetical protein
VNAIIEQMTPQAAMDTLPHLIDKAARNLAAAAGSAEVLEARNYAGVVYDAAKKAARMARAKNAHDDLIARAHRAQADALEIEAAAKRRLADEYDAAQQRGEIAGHGGDKVSNVAKSNVAPTSADIGIRRDEIFESRRLRDAEKLSPGITRETLDKALEEGREPSKALLREAVFAAVEQTGRRSSRPRNPLHKPNPLFDRVAKFSSLCEGIAAERENLNRLASYDEIPTTADRLNRNVDAAWQVIKEFREMRDA